MNKKYLIVVILTLAASLVVFRVHNVESIKNEKLFSFPLQIGEWFGKDIPMEDWVFKSLETPYGILRDYRSHDGETVNLAITWYDDREIAFHAPEACLGGVGNKVKKKNVYHVKMKGCQDYPIGKLLIERNQVRVLVLYYFINDSFITPNQAKLRTRILLKKLQFKRTSAAFVRLMTQIYKTEEYTAIKLENFFWRTLPLVIEHTDTKRIRLPIKYNKSKE